MFSLFWLFILKMSNLQKKKSSPRVTNFFFKLFCHICPLLLLPCPPFFFFVLVKMLTAGRYPEPTSLPASWASSQMWTFPCMTTVPYHIDEMCNPLGSSSRVFRYLQWSPPRVLPHSPVHSKLIHLLTHHGPVWLFWPFILCFLWTNS